MELAFSTVDESLSVMWTNQSEIKKKCDKKQPICCRCLAHLRKEQN